MPPVELLIFIHAFVALLKFSASSTVGVQVRLEELVRLNGTPGHTDAGFAPALTVGIGSTVIVIVKGLLTHPPLPEVAVTIY